MRGFSLLELSLVLVILGLLTGGILAGQSLIRAAELRSFTETASRFSTALYAFKDRYFSEPGDMANATAFWGAANSNVNTCRTTASTGKETCNGNGDGVVGPITGVFKNAPERYELPRAMQHLANAGLIGGAYTGAMNPPAVAQYLKLAIGINSPATRIANVGIAYYYFNRVGASGTTNAFHFSTTSQNVLMFGGQDQANTGNESIGTAFMQPSEAWNIDTKLDDGKPGMGKIIATGVSYPSDTTQCTTSFNGDDYATAEYKLDHTNSTCGFYIRN